MTVTPTPTRSLVRRVLVHPLTWAAVCLAGAIPLLGTAHDFWGFLLSLVAGWVAAHVVVRGLFRLQPTPLAVSVHVALSAAAGWALFAMVQPGQGWGAVPPTVRTALSFAAITFSGWIWLALLGRATAAVQASSEHRAARLVEPEWVREQDDWILRLPAVVLRRSTYVAATAVLGVLAVGAMGFFAFVFADLAQRMGPMAMLLLLGWTVGLPVYLLVLVVARGRTVDVELRIGRGGVRVRTGDGDTLMDAGPDGIRSLLWSARNAPTRIVVRPVEGAGLVLLVGMARRPRGTAATLPALPPGLLRIWEEAGLGVSSTRRNRAGELSLARVGIVDTVDRRGGRSRTRRRDEDEGVSAREAGGGG